MSVQETQEKKKRNKPLLIALIGTGALVATVGGVFAANTIQINGGSNIEFGQGIQAASACDGTVTTTINQSYSGTGDVFNATSVVVSDIDEELCAGKTFHVSLIGSTGSVVCDVDGTHATGSNKDALPAPADGTSTITVSIASGCDASTVSKVAITTS